MNGKSAKNEIVFMMILSFICAALLGGTRAAIGERAELSERTVKAVYDILKESEAGSAGEVAVAVKCRDNYDDYKRFLKEFKLVQKGKIKYWRNASDTAMIACEATGSGMWGEITIVFVYNSNKRTLIGLHVTEQNETAGLGSRIAEKEFCSQFANVSLNNSMYDEKNNDKPAVKVDAITGATTSSRAVEKLLGKALRDLL